MRSVLQLEDAKLWAISDSITLQLLEVFAQVVHELVKRGFLKWPKVYVDPSCGPELPLLQSMVLSMKGEMAASSSKTPTATPLPGSAVVEI